MNKTKIHTQDYSHCEPAVLCSALPWPYSRSRGIETYSPARFAVGSGLTSMVSVCNEPTVQHSGAGLQVICVHLWGVGRVIGYHNSICDLCLHENVVFIHR